MGNTLLPNNPTLDEIKDLIRRINGRIKIINASVNQEELTIDSPIATIIQSNSTDPGEYTTTDIDTSNFYTKNEINTLLQGKVNSTDLNTLLNGKQDTLEFDNTPTANSSNLVRSGGIKSALDGKQDTITPDTVPTASSSNLVTSGGVKSYVDNKCRRTLLWTNPHPTYWDADTEITLSSDDYDYLDFEIKMTASMAPYYIQRIGNIAANGVFLLWAIGVQTDDLGNNYIMGRSCTCSSRTQIVMTTGIIARWGASAVQTHHSFAIPVKIYGIKYS